MTETRIPDDFVPVVRPEHQWRGYPKDSVSYFIITELQGLSFAMLRQVLGLSGDELAGKLVELAKLGVIEPPPGYTPKDFLIPEALLPELDEIDSSPMNEDVELDDELKEEILRVHAALPRLSQMELFGLKPGFTQEEVTKAYKALTKRFHPDRYYGKELGSFKRRMEEIFDAVNKAYPQLLQEATTRKTPDDLAYQPTIAASGPPNTPPKSPSPKPAPRVSTDAKTMAVSSAHGGGAPSTPGREPSTSTPVPPPEEEISFDKPTALPGQVKKRGISLKDLLTKAISHNKEKAELHFNEGKKALQEGNYASAASHLKVAMTFDPSNEEIREAYRIAATKAGEISAVHYVKKAELEWEMGHKEEAVHFQMMALDLSRQEKYLLRAAEMLLALGRFTQAKDLAQEAADQNPQGKGLLMVAKVYLAAEKYRRARSTLQEYLQLHPEDSEAKLLLSVVESKI